MKIPVMRDGWLLVLGFGIVVIPLLILLGLIVEFFS
jgi:hypothetical protein